MLHKMHKGWQVCKCTMLTDWNTCQQVGHEKPYLYLLRIHNVNWEIEGSQHDVAVCVAVMRRYLRGARWWRGGAAVRCSASRTWPRLGWWRRSPLHQVYHLSTHIWTKNKPRYICALLHQNKRRNCCNEGVTTSRVLCGRYMCCFLFANSSFAYCSLLGSSRPARLCLGRSAFVCPQEYPLKRQYAPWTLSLSTN